MNACLIRRHTKKWRIGMHCIWPAFLCCISEIFRLGCGGRILVDSACLLHCVFLSCHSLAFALFGISHSLSWKHRYPGAGLALERRGSRFYALHTSGMLACRGLLFFIWSRHASFGCNSTLMVRSLIEGKGFGFMTPRRCYRQGWDAPSPRYLLMIHEPRGQCRREGGVDRNDKAS